MDKNKFALPVTAQVQRFLKHLNGALLRNEGRGWINFLKRMLIIIPFRSSKSWVRVLKTFSREQHTLARANGVAFVVRRLKAQSVLLQQAVGGHRHSSVQDLGVAVSRTGRGIPRSIPAIHRRLILRDRRYLIAWLSILNIYRILVFPGTLKLSTITEPGKMLSGDLIIGIRTFIQTIFWPLVRKHFGSNTIADGSLEKNQRGNPPLITDWARTNLIPKPFSVQKASSFQGSKDSKEISTSRVSMVATAKAWMADGPMYSYFKEWVEGLAPTPPRILLTKKPAYYGNRTYNQMPKGLELLEDLGLMAKVDLVSKNKSGKPTRLGRLSTKVEAAGKIRVFAIVDCWTQWLLYPLHSAIFALLRRIPQDGTFDQHAPVRRLKLTKKDFVASYDLSAATDRLPLQVQKMVLGPVLGIHLAETWGNLLTKREYWLKDKSYTYAVGQPMGALSSWAMLALTHHMIVQYAAWKSRAVLPGAWFGRYALLGDDIQIAHRQVAESYLSVMGSLGVGIGLAKSLVSNIGVGEFAKRYYIPQDASPISLKEVVVSWHVAGNLVELVRKRANSKITLATVLAYLGYGYRSVGSVNKRYHKMGTRMRNWLLLLTLPGQPFGVDWDLWLARLSTSKISTRDLQASYKSLVGVLTERLHKRIKSYNPLIKRAWDIQMLKRNVSLGFAKAQPEWMFLADKVWDSQKNVSYEISQITAEIKRISQIRDAKEAFLALLRVEERIDLLELPKDLEQRTSVIAKFSWPKLVDSWYRVRSSATSKKPKT